ncbi:hypothetical protein U1Q18_041805 [Sarracenia purpurea var. burkii]
MVRLSLGVFVVMFLGLSQDVVEVCDKSGRSKLVGKFFCVLMFSLKRISMVRLSLDDFAVMFFGTKSGRCDAGADVVL